MTTGTSRIQIERAGPTDVRTASATLARAFHEDPVVAWVIPDPERRRRQLPSGFELFVEAFLRHDETWVLPDRGGAALWAPPGVAPIPEEEAESFEQRAASILGEDADRFFELLGLMEEHHPEEPSFYLAFVGVVPERQGQGLGRALLQPVLRRSDETSSPGYLEATNPANRRLYERLGFETIGEIPLPDGPCLWPMWREPVAREEGSR